MVSDGDLVLPLLSTEGKVVAHRVIPAASDKDIVIPALTTDGKITALKVIPFASDKDSGLAVLGVDGILTPVKTGGGVLVFASNVTILSTDMGNITLNFCQQFKDDKIEQIGDDSFTTGGLGALALIEFKADLIVTGNIGPLQNIGIYNETTKTFDKLDPAGGLNGTGGFDLTIWRGLLVIIGNYAGIIGQGLLDARDGVAWDGTQYSTIGLDDATSPWFTNGDNPEQSISYNDLLIASGARIIRKYEDGGVGTWAKLFAGDTDPADFNHAIVLWKDKATDKDVIVFAGEAFVKSWFLGDTSYTSFGVPAGVSSPQILAMTVYQGDLIVAGEFETISGVTAKSVARWDGTVWSALGSGFATGARIEALIVSEGRLFAGGLFSANGNGDNMNSFAVLEVDWVEPDTTLLGANLKAFTEFSGNLDDAAP